MQGLAKAGTLSIIGVYAEDSRQFPIGLAMNRNLTIRMGNCHRSTFRCCSNMCSADASTRRRSSPR